MTFLLMNNISDLFFNNTKPFWHWVREISKYVFNVETDQEAFPYFAYSNIHKCQAAKNKKSLYNYDYVIQKELSKNCVQKAGWIYREINEINPKNVILFLGYAKDCYLAKIFIQNKEDVNTFDYSLYGLKSKTFKHGKIIQLREGNRRYILTNHPQGTPIKTLEEIKRIIKTNDWTGAIPWKMPNPDEI